MIINKALTYSLLAAITLVPWNATAVNRFSFGNLLPKTSFSSAATIASTAAADLVEGLLVKSLLEISEGKHQQALNTIDELIQSVPNFKLAHLVRGDLLMAQGKYLQAFGDPVNNRPDAVQDLQEEARVRIERYLAKQSQAEEKQPNLILAPNAQQSHLMLIDTSKSRLYLYQKNNDHLKYVADYYITVGKNGVEKQSEGDKRTPIGVYFASTKLKQQLPDFYGEGAYPLSYPNEWDKAHNRNGSGIWLHGTPSSTYSRPPRASDGCVVVANQDLKALEPALQSGKTPIIIANNLEWLNDSSTPEREKEILNTEIDNWLNDWKSQDTEKYLSYYSKDFSTNGINYQQWAEHKYRVQANKPKIDISMSNISMFSYPDPQKKLVVVDFTQNFSSSHLKNKMQKRQYWIQEGNRWKIIYEGAA
ncbi:MAG: hypothetical protein CTY35_08075 [Methylotenera sp.]|jgi:murein L,D-transpeptidase YafK|uniref:L,D-TPase catalytic domain-containing protein n=1 Tax=Methylotenera mobilis TaxID=359408 RepID=A0A351RCA6_9PROT|nr:L,D-transpeptidase family protein [Methylotenera mobilis]PPC96568.1 MAG: hypothetical protein CTY32_04450 [Methylotenera sp.]PPC96820.1 MAG: hypothetical protein CTY35_08075 [Methylotenera sp.]HBA09677.1 hypothetical protein [Methylotenera mobilis]